VEAPVQDSTLQALPHVDDKRYSSCTLQYICKLRSRCSDHDGRFGRNFKEFNRHSMLANNVMDFLQNSVDFAAAEKEMIRK
jgi:hypothetical protein